MKNIRTFKVTFYDKNMDVFKVETFHNVSDQGAFCEHLAILINTLELQDVVRCEYSNGENCSEAVNYFVRHDLAEIRANA